MKTGAFLRYCATLAALTALLTVAMVAVLSEEPPPKPAAPACAVVSSPVANRDPDCLLIGELFTRFDGEPSNVDGSWPHPLGPQYDGINRECLSLTAGAGTSAPSTLWTIPLTDGYAGAVVHEGRVFVMDYDPGRRQEFLRCFSLRDGREIWRRGHPLELNNAYGYLHMTPSVSDDHVVALGGKGHLFCCDPETGSLRWTQDLPVALGFRAALDFCVQTPLIDGKTIVVAVGGGDAYIAGFDAASGRILWKTPNPGSSETSFSSVVPASLEGRKAYLYQGMKGTIAISGERETAGKILWESRTSGLGIPVSTPVVIEQDRIFLTGGLGRGSELLQGRWDSPDGAQPVWTRETWGGFASTVQRPIYHGSHLFAVLPDNTFACLDPWKSRKIVWTSGKNRKFRPYDPFLMGDEKFYVLSEDGMVTVIDAVSDRYAELGRFRALSGRSGWHPPMALASGFLLIRDFSRLVCIDLHSKP